MPVEGGTSQPEPACIESKDGLVTNLEIVESGCLYGKRGSSKSLNSHARKIEPLHQLKHRLQNWNRFACAGIVDTEVSVEN